MNKKTVNINEIDLQNNYYKLSYPLNTRLVDSISQIGVLENPLLIKKDKYVIFSGHNRINALIKLNKTNIESIILDNISIELFNKVLFKKIYNNQISNTGKLKAIYILINDFNLDYDSIKEFKKALNLPSFIFNKGLKSFLEFYDNLKMLPANIYGYITIKDVPYRFYSIIFSLSIEAVSILDKLVSIKQISVNYFRNIVDMIYDLSKLGLEKKAVEIIENNIKKENTNEKSIYDSLFKLRYPQYSDKLNEINKIIEKLKKYNITVKIPEYLEGNYIELLTRVKKIEDIEKIFINEQNIKISIGKLLDSI